MARSTTRRHWFQLAVRPIGRTLLLASLPFVAVVADPVALDGQQSDPGATVADLEQMLKSGLKARKPAEFDFIRRVTTKVADGDLPVDMVQSTFLWARRHQPYPYPYFERGLRERAARAGLTL